MELIPLILIVIKKNWDNVSTKGIFKSIWRFEFHVDSIDAKNIYCRIPQYRNF